MSNHSFHVGKETIYYTDGKKTDVYFVDFDGEYVISHISKGDVLELIRVLNFAVSNKVEKREVRNG